MSGPVIECVLNFSEGTDARRVRTIVAAMRAPEVSLLDWSLDGACNCSEAVIAGDPAAVAESAVRGAGKAAELINLTRQKGNRPLIGAAGVVSFVPVSGIRLEQCALLARQAGLEIWRRFKVPVYLYGAAAARPDRANLEEVCREPFEELRKTVDKDSSRRPDIGGANLHPTAGACAVGARKLLVEYNLRFDSADVAVARAIAREIRAASGGLKGIRALAAMAQGRAQLSMSITDLEATPLSLVYRTVAALALRHKTAPIEGKITGLLPETACERDSEWMRQLCGFDPEASILERRLSAPRAWPEEN